MDRTVTKHIHQEWFYGYKQQTRHVHGGGGGKEQPCVPCLLTGGLHDRLAHIQSTKYTFSHFSKLSCTVTLKMGKGH